MKTFRCVPCDDVPARLRQDFFAMQDAGGRNWVCREQEPPHLAGSGWEGWAHYGGVASIFAQLIGDAVTAENPFQDVERVMGKTVAVEVADGTELPGALAAHKG
jgi:hypothetical protein